MTRTFITATDEGVIDMIQRAQRRLAVIAPGVTAPVAKALTERIVDLPRLSLTVILDADPEVYRMGYGDPEALTIIRRASDESMFDLREQPSIRIGVIISDDKTIVYAPVSRNIEAGSTSPEHPNAIQLGEATTDTLAVASGTEPAPEMPETGPDRELPPSHEIGQKALEPGKVEIVELDLKANPPRPFDLTRRLTVFVTEVQFVDLRLTNAILSSRTIRLPPHFLKFEDDGLRQLIKSSLKLPFDFSKELDVRFESHRGNEILPEVEGKEPKKFETEKISEAVLKRQRKEIADKFFYNWDERGTVILRKDKADFQDEITRLISMTKAYQGALRDQVAEAKTDFRKKIVKEFLKFWITSLPEHLKCFKNLGEDVIEKICNDDLERTADDMFDKAVTLDAPEAKYVYKNIPVEDLKNEDLMASLCEMMEDADVDPETIEKLFYSDDVVTARDSLI